MAEPEDVQKALRISLKKFYIVATAILVVIVLTIVFKDSVGDLFKGQLVLDQPQITIDQEPIVGQEPVIELPVEPEDLTIKEERITTPIDIVRAVEEAVEEEPFKAVQGSTAEETEKVELDLLDDGETVTLEDFEELPAPEDELPAPEDELPPPEDELPPPEDELPAPETTTEEELPAPEDELEEDFTEPETAIEEEPEITIESAEVDPLSFNPIYEETKIKYELSEDAQVEISIHDDKGVKILTLLDNKNKDKGENSIWWNGTNKKDNTGTVVDSGIYTYKIIAKDPATGEPKDTKSGTVKAIYLEAVDFEEIIEDDTPPSLVAATTAQTQTDQNSTATIAMQETPPETTSGTGPETIIYLLFPVAGYLLSRKKLK